MVKNLPAMWETQVRSLGWKDPQEKGMGTHSSILAWKISWTEEPGGLQSMGSQESETTEWLTHTVGAKIQDRWNGGLQCTINRSYSWKDGQKGREAIMEGIRAKTFPGNILAARCEFNFNIVGAGGWKHDLWNQRDFESGSILEILSSQASSLSLDFLICLSTFHSKIKYGGGT